MQLGLTTEHCRGPVPLVDFVHGARAFIPGRAPGEVTVRDHHHHRLPIGHRAPPTSGNLTTVSRADVGRGHRSSTRNHSPGQASGDAMPIDTP